MIAEQLRAIGRRPAAHRAGAGRPQHAHRPPPSPLLVAEERSGRRAVAARRRITSIGDLNALLGSRRSARLPARMGGLSSPSACGRPRRRPAMATSRVGDSRCRRPPGVQARRRASSRSPSGDRGRAYLASGRHLWNTGMFRVHRADAVVEELERHAPEVLAACRGGLGGREPRPRFHPPRSCRALRRAPSISIDYAVMERTSRAAVVPATIGWSDVGSWGALWEIGAKDARGNVAVGDVLLRRREELLCPQRGMLTGVVGLEDAGRGGHRGRGAGDAARRRAGREEGGRPAEGRRPARGASRIAALSALGLLRER